MSNTNLPSNLDELHAMDVLNDSAEVALLNAELDHMEQMPCENDENEEHDPFLSDAEADENAMASAGFGEDESYNCCCGGDE